MQRAGEGRCDYRAFAYITDWIAANRTRFEKHATPCYGMVEADKVYVIASEFRSALEEGGFSYTKCIKGFRSEAILHLIRMRAVWKEHNARNEYRESMSELYA